MASEKGSRRTTRSEPYTDGQEDVPSSDTACTGWSNAACQGTPLCPPRCPRFLDRTGKPLLVSPLREEHLEALVTMYESIRSRTHGLPPPSRGGIEQWLTHLTTTGWNLIALDREAVVGHIGVAPTGASDPSFVIFVRDDYHGRGIGTELVAQAIAHAAAEGYEALTLLVTKWNHPAITVYTNLGFETTSDDSIDLEMRLTLDDPIAEAVQRPPAERSE
jgi:GNAT superfamily N-acetyltransferase